MKAAKRGPWPTQNVLPKLQVCATFFSMQIFVGGYNASLGSIGQVSSANLPLTEGPSASLPFEDLMLTKARSGTGAQVQKLLVPPALV
jgi:hypothetical protein